uniref:Large ribosomal subunit protein uL22c n=1 Tax=Anotrichium furcellatum TaxID=41999 RepID=A0A4D6WKG5_9FLOR|nr:ribosomal protein L22 [Anotrichium furcellatum]
MITTQAKSKYIRISPYKARRILKQIQGKNYIEAKLTLEFLPYKACKYISKILESAINNFSNKKVDNISKNKIFIKKAVANQGPILKRFQPRAQGRAFPIRKPTCHIEIIVETNI